jgi:hypothetical protein
MSDAVNCWSCGKAISLSYLKRHGRCSYCQKPLRDMVVELPSTRTHSGWTRGVIVAIGKIVGPDTRVRVRLLKGVQRPIRKVSELRPVNS